MPHGHCIGARQTAKEIGRLNLRTPLVSSIDTHRDQAYPPHLVHGGENLRRRSSCAAVELFRMKRPANGRAHKPEENGRTARIGQPRHVPLPPSAKLGVGFASRSTLTGWTTGPQAAAVDRLRQFGKCTRGHLQILSSGLLAAGDKTATAGGAAGPRSDSRLLRRSLGGHGLCILHCATLSGWRRSDCLLADPIADRAASAAGSARRMGVGMPPLLDWVWGLVLGWLLALALASGTAYLVVSSLKGEPGRHLPAGQPNPPESRAPTTATVPSQTTFR
jgi:hypothetical protein